MAGSNCTFNVGSDCVIVRKDIFKVIQPETNNVLKFIMVPFTSVFEVIQPEANRKIKLNGYGIKGFKYVSNHVITIDGKEIELSEESYNNLKQQLK